MEAKTFSTTLKEADVTIDGRIFTIKELDGRQKGIYLNKMGKRIVLNDQGRIKAFSDYAGLESVLLSACLYKPDGELASMAELEAWPSTVLSDLFDIAQDLSGLKEEARKKLEAEAKNS